MENVHIMEHPLIRHKISRLRDENTGTNEFRKLTEEIAMLMGYEALRDLPLEEVEVKTPIETCRTPVVSGKKLAVVPVLRAGLGMVNGIDPKTDDRIDFVGGIRGKKELERRCHLDCMAAFAMYPTSIQQLFAVADAGLLMPPKSTWFEPKLRSGLFIHEI